jgi:hypothetical protein
MSRHPQRSSRYSAAKRGSRRPRVLLCAGAAKARRQRSATATPCARRRALATPSARSFPLGQRRGPIHAPNGRKRSLGEKPAESRKVSATHVYKRACGSVVAVTYFGRRALRRLRSHVRIMPGALDHSFKSFHPRSCRAHLRVTFAGHQRCVIWNFGAHVCERDAVDCAGDTADDFAVVRQLVAGCNVAVDIEHA